MRKSKKRMEQMINEKEKEGSYKKEKEKRKMILNTHRGTELSTGDELEGEGGVEEEDDDEEDAEDVGLRGSSSSIFNSPIAPPTLIPSKSFPNFIIDCRKSAPSPSSPPLSPKRLPLLALRASIAF